QPQPGIRVASATYRGPYESHGTMAPNCAIADVTRNGALVMCSAQGLYQISASVARLVNLPADKVRVKYYAGSNTYGSSCYADAAEGAAIMSQELGKPIRLQFSRQDEFGWDNYGPAHLAEVRGAVDGQGKIVAFDYQAWGHDAGAGVTQTDTTIQLALGAKPVVVNPAAGGGGLFQLRISQNDMYDIPNRRLLDHRASALGYLRIGPLRAPLDPP